MLLQKKKYRYKQKLLLNVTGGVGEKLSKKKSFNTEGLKIFFLQIGGRIFQRVRITDTTNIQKL